MLWASALTLATKMSRPPSASGGLRHPGAQRLCVGHIDPAAPALHPLAGERRDGLVHRRLVARAQRHIAPFGRQLLGDGAADAARAAGDDRVLALEIEIHIPLLSADRADTIANCVLPGAWRD